MIEGDFVKTKKKIYFAVKYYFGFIITDQYLYLLHITHLLTNMQEATGDSRMDYLRFYTLVAHGISAGLVQASLGSAGASVFSRWSLVCPVNKAGFAL